MKIGKYRLYQKVKVVLSDKNLTCRGVIVGRATTFDAKGKSSNSIIIRLNDMDSGHLTDYRGRRRGYIREIMVHPDNLEVDND